MGGLKYNSCSMINLSALNFNGRIDTGEKCLTLCCEPVQNRPASAFKDTARETIEGFIKMRKAIIDESKRHAFVKSKKNANNSARGKRLYTATAGCAKCANYQLGEWDGDDLIHYINLSMYPAPCQCKCIYCGVHKGETGIFDKTVCGEYYENMFDALDYARDNGLIAANATWQVSSGEVAIHPYKDRILNLVKNQRAMFYTNCFIFDDKVAQNLSLNPNSAINLSIDSGMPQTWFKIKGVNNFKDVTDNLVKYFKASARPGQITLKYIILPGINDNMEDYHSVIEIMKILQVKHLTIARDTRIKYGNNPKQSESLLGAAGYLFAMLTKNKLTSDMYTFAPNERQTVATFANEMLQAGKV